MLSRKEVVESLKRILNALRVEYSKILLFGSRSKSDFDEESDWDFLIILKKEITVKEKKALWHEIYKRFHEYFPFESVDIILKDTESFENERMVVNTIAHEVYLEGVEV
jgi:predicted nucleotidyltransferase